MYDSDLSSLSRWENCQSAYMLIYERKHKFPLKTVFNEVIANEIVNNLKNNAPAVTTTSTSSNTTNTANPSTLVPQDSTTQPTTITFSTSNSYSTQFSSISNLVSYKEDEAQAVMRSTNFFVHDPVKESSEFNTNLKLIMNTIYHDISKNEYYTYLPYYTETKLIPKEFFFEALEDNQSFQKLKTTSDDSFQRFLEAIGKTLNSTLSDLDITSASSALSISRSLLNFMINNLSSPEKKDMLGIVLDKLLSIIPKYPSVVGKELTDILFQKHELVRECLLNEEDHIVLTYSRLLLTIAREFYPLAAGKVMEANLKDKYGNDFEDYFVKISDMFVSLYPKIARNLFSSITPVHSFIKSISEFGDEMVEYLMAKGVITLIVAFLIGRDSPYYNDYTAVLDNHTEYNRGYATHCDELVGVLFSIYRRTTDFAELVAKCVKTGNEAMKKLLPTSKVSAFNINNSYLKIYIYI